MLPIQPLQINHNTNNQKMTNLQNRNETTANSISAISAQLAEMQRMMLNLQGEVRVLEQQHKAQETLTKEWNSTSKTIEKQFKDACSVYGFPEAIDDMVNDIQTIADEVKNNFESHAESDRFLNQETAEIEDEAVVMPLLNSELPDKEDDIIILSPSHIEIVLRPVNEDCIKVLKQMFNVSNKITKFSSLCLALSKHQLTHSKIFRLIENIQSQQLLLNGVS